MLKQSSCFHAQFDLSHPLKLKNKMSWPYMAITENRSSFLVIFVSQSSNDFYDSFNPNLLYWIYYIICYIDINTCWCIILNISQSISTHIFKVQIEIHYELFNSLNTVIYTLIIWGVRTFHNTYALLQNVRMA